MLSNKNITVTQKVLHCMFSGTLGVNNKHKIEIA